MNKNGKIFGIISIVDVLVILAIIFMGVSIYARVNSQNSKITTENKHLEYTILVEDVRINTVNALEKGGKIYDSKTKESMGEIKGIEYTPAKYNVVKNTGEVVRVEYPERYDVKVKVNIDGRTNESGYYSADNKYLSVGTTTTISSKYVLTNGEIIEIASCDDNESAH